MADFTAEAAALARVGHRLDARGWVLGTSGNLSVVLGRAPLRLAITRSGESKGDLTPDAIIEVDERGAAVHPERGQPSAETLLHVVIARARGAGAILHTHSIWATLLSEQHAGAAGMAIDGYEMLKGLEGVTTHAHREWLPILENDQDMSRLSVQVDGMLAAQPECHGFLLRRHGLYTWADTLAKAVRHVEIIEFLLEAVGRSGAHPAR